jgi:hypothetical protein
MQDCAWCSEDMDEDEQVLLTEGGDVLCLGNGMSCGETFREMCPDEVASVGPLEEVHSDWRT